MLHIFWVHSHITYLVSKEIILTLGKEEEIIIYLARRYKLPNVSDFNDKKIEVIEFPWYRHNIRLEANILHKKNILKTRNNAKQCLSLFNEYINNKPYILYIPTSWEYSITLMMTHPKCVSYYYIEEGTLAYLKNGDKERTSIIRRILVKLVYGLDYMGMYAILKNFKGSYAVSDKAFPWHNKERNIVEWSKVNNYYEEMSSYEKIIIFDYLDFTSEELLKFSTQLNNWLKENNINNFIYKFHPATKGNDSEKIIRSSLKQFYSKEANSDFVVEMFILNHPLMIYCVNSISSISMYATTHGCKCYYIKYNKEENIFNMLDIVE